MNNMLIHKNGIGCANRRCSNIKLYKHHENTARVLIKLQKENVKALRFRLYLCLLFWIILDIYIYRHLQPERTPCQRSSRS